MKILRLQSSNIQRVTAIDITPDPAVHVIKIGGKNGQGKSSVLDTISIALGGQALCPAEPIHDGELEGMARLDLGELIVTRRFRRDNIHSATCARRDADEVLGTEAVPCNCVQTFSPTTSTLTVANKDGAKYPTPQAILDRLKSDLTFDPHAFARASEKDQNAILRRIAGVDTAKLDDDRKMAVALRTDLNRQVRAKEALLTAAKHYPEAPAEEVNVDEVNKVLVDAEVSRRRASVAASELLKASQVRDDRRAKCDAWEKKIIQLEEQLATAKLELTAATTEWSQAVSVTVKLEGEADAAKALVPDVTAIQRKLADIDDINKKVRANVGRANIAADLARVVEAAKKQDATVDACDTEKCRLLAEAKFPVEGLGLTEDSVSFNGVPFAQAGSANQLRTSVAIGMALNPALRVLRIDNGNMLDEDSMKLLEEMAAEGDYQLWLEWVTSDASQVSVFIEDGHVA